MNNKPPKIAEWILTKFTGSFVKYSALGDFNEIYNELLIEKGKLNAALWYWLQALKSIPSFFIDKTFWGIIMFSNYFKLTIRNLLKHKQTSFINIFGLSVAIGISIVSYLFYEFGYYRDSFHENVDNIFVVESVIENKGEDRLWGTSPLPIGPALKDNFAQIESYVRINRSRAVIRYQDNVFNERITFTDENFFEMFTFPLHYGNKKALSNNNNVVLSFESAEKYFGKVNPVGKEIEITLPGSSKETFFVSGVTEKLPKNSSFIFDFVINFNKQKDILINDFNDWKLTTNATFIQLTNPADISTVSNNLDNFIAIQNSANYERQIKEFRFEHLSTMAQNSHKVRGSLVYVTIFPGQMLSLFFTGLFLLILACFNYMNISIVSATGRLKEIGVRKVLGGNRKNLIVQFIGENLIICFIALFFGVLMSKYFFAPGFNSAFSVFNFEVNPFENTNLLIFLVSLLLLVGIGSGLYPSIFISSFKPVNILKGKARFKSKNRFTKSLLVVQFIISMVLIVDGIVFVKNTEYQKSRDWGYNNEQAIVIPLETPAQFNAINDELKTNLNIIGTAGSISHVGRSKNLISIESNLDNYEVVNFTVGDNYLETLGIKLLQGRPFQKEIQTDIENSIIVNETFVKIIGLKEPIGKRILYDEKPYYIIGVVKDFHYANFMNMIEPVVFFKTNEENYNYLVVKAEANTVNKTEESIKATWKKLFPDSPYKGYFQDSVFNGYKFAMDGVATTSAFAAIISLLITCMGIFGLVTLNIQKRMKEMSIRKVLGASSGSIMRLINKEFIWIFIISAFVAIPSAFFGVNLLLKSLWKYYEELNYIPFVSSIILVLISAGITISIQVYKAVVRNPVENLRYE